MTFSEFQQSRHEVSSLAEVIPDYEAAPDQTDSGFVYIGKLWIAKVGAHWPEAARDGVRTMTRYHEAAERLGIPQRTLAQVRTALDDPKLSRDARHSLAALIVRHGRCEPMARAYARRVEMESGQ